MSGTFFFSWLSQLQLTRYSAISNALYFSLGAQLAWLNDNKTASDEAIKTYDLLTSIGLVTDDFDVYDGLTVPECDSINKFQFSYVAATLLEGAAYTYNYVSTSFVDLK